LLLQNILSFPMHPPHSMLRSADAGQRSARTFPPEKQNPIALFNKDSPQALFILFVILI